MENIVAGLIAAFLVIVFLAFYAVKIASIPLWLIIGGVIAMILFDFRDSLTDSQNGE